MGELEFEEEKIVQRCLELRKEILMEKKRIHDEYVDQLQLRVISENQVNSCTKKMDFIKKATDGKFPKDDRLR